MSKDFHGLDSGKAYRIEKELADGGQGWVYLVNDPTTPMRYAAKWYKDGAATESQRNQIQELVRSGPPKLDDPGIHFIWPIEGLALSGSQGFGYLMPLIDTKRFRSPVAARQESRQQKKEFPSLPVLCRISRRIATALHVLHGAGLAYCDINERNIMFDPIQGEIVVYDNDNVIVNNSHTSIRGVWEFMAPEVALGQTKPNAESDLYSVAMLLYHLWVWYHPMEGKRTFNVAWDDLARKKYFAKQPAFMFHPTDTTNHPYGIPAFNVYINRWNRICPPKLKGYFTDIFVNGVHEPTRRKRLPEWIRLFLELESNISLCGCGTANVWDGEQKPLPCAYCRKEIPLGLSLRVRQGPFGDAVLLAHTGAELRHHHLDVTDFTAKSTEPVGRVEANPKRQGLVILRNLSIAAWDYKTPDGTLLKVEPKQAGALIPGAELTIGNKTIQIQQI